MGTDIHTVAQRRIGDRWETIADLSPFDNRNYGVFGFLADVRNYSAVPPLSQPRGIPGDFRADDAPGEHSFSWLTVEELLAFDYDQPTEDRRCTREIKPGRFDGGQTAEPGEGKATTFREFLGPWFFKDLDALKAAGADRIVFGFDS